MAAYYLDTSALVKLYVAEPGHVWIRGICRPAARNALFVSQLTTVELEVALIRKAAERAISEADREKSIALFRQHLRSRYSMVPVTEDVFSRARQLVRLPRLPHPLRTYDALHLASAQQTAEMLATLGAALMFAAADRRLLAVAASQGLATENPEDHP